MYFVRYCVSGLLASFYATLLGCCGRGENLGTTTCLNSVVGGKQGYVPCRMPSLQQVI